MTNINTKTYVDVHTTGQKLEFGSLRQYDRFLKENGKYALTKKDIERIKENKQPKSDYKKLAEEAWREREKHIPEIKERMAKEEYMRRNGRSV